MGNGVILDTNCFSHVFNRNDKRHPDFSDFMDWLCSGPGYLVYGGSKYLEELSSAKHYLKIFQLLNQYNKAVAYDNISIDKEMDRIIKMVDNPKFDDPHLAAIVIITKSLVICTGDTRSIPFLSRKDIYNGKVKCPKFYTGASCSSLLKTSYIGKQRKLNKKSVLKVMDVVNGTIV